VYGKAVFVDLALVESDGHAANAAGNCASRRLLRLVPVLTTGIGAKGGIGFATFGSRHGHQVPLGELADSKERVRSALNRATRKRGRNVVTASDADFLHIWNEKSDR
jgi:hypothetical protein